MIVPLLSLRTEEGRKKEREIRLRMSAWLQQKEKTEKQHSANYDARISSMQATIDEHNKKEMSQAMAKQVNQLVALQKQMKTVQQLLRKVRVGSPVLSLTHCTILMFSIKIFTKHCTAFIIDVGRPANMWLTSVGEIPILS